MAGLTLVSRCLSRLPSWQLALEGPHLESSCIAWSTPRLQSRMFGRVVCWWGTTGWAGRRMLPVPLPLQWRRVAWPIPSPVRDSCLKSALHRPGCTNLAIIVNPTLGAVAQLLASLGQAGAKQTFVFKSCNQLHSHACRAAITFGIMLWPNIWVLFFPIPQSNFLQWLTGLNYSQMIRYHRWGCWVYDRVSM